MPPDAGAELTGPLRVREITSTAGLHALAPAWHELWRHDPAATPFQAPAWLIPWWHHFGAGGLWTMAFWSEGPCAHNGAAAPSTQSELAGVAPLYVHTVRGHRTVRLLGAGLSDYLDVSARPAERARVAAGAVAELRRHPARWHAVEFQSLARGSSLLADASVPGADIAEAEPCPGLDLDVGAFADGFPRVGSDRLRHNVLADRRRIERQLGRVELIGATEHDATALFGELRRLHAARWQMRGEAGVLADATTWAFQGEAFLALRRAGIARLYALRVRDRIAGVYYGFVHRERAYYYLGGFDPEFHRFGLGNQLIAHAMAEAMREGATFFDFLRGAEPYKYRWGATDRATFCRRLAPDRPRSGADDAPDPGPPAVATDPLTAGTAKLDLEFQTRVERPRSTTRTAA